MTKNIALSDLHPHPRNPRFTPRQDVVDQIAAQITSTGEFDPAHALIVRKNAAGYEIISGHHRALAAAAASLQMIPCWVREMSDDDAYMALVLNNAQGELHALELGRHAVDSKFTTREYAAAIGMSEDTLSPRVWAARVAKVLDIKDDIRPYWSSLAAIHPAPEWMWPALATHVIADELTVEGTRNLVGKLKGIDEPPEWSDKGIIAAKLVNGELRPSDLAKFAGRVDATKGSLVHNKEDSERLIAELDRRLKEWRPVLLSQVEEVCQDIEQEQAELIKQRKQEDLLQTKRDEEVRARIARLRRNVSLEEWKTLKEDEQSALLRLSIDDENSGRFTEQKNDSIEWAQWTWNPVTGCLHDCPYCYARDIAQQPRMSNAYPNGFAPAFRPISLLTPRTMKVPKEAGTDTRYRNVFTCSMADLFGRWVPREWIEAVLAEIRNAPQWNFLCLTKFPKRMAEFDIPTNAWMGTTVDLQARVANAEAAFDKVKAGVRWLSIEPMLEPLKFKHLDRFDWVVIGGSSRSSQTPEWRPPFEWIMNLVEQAKAANCKVYFKTNLLQRRLLELPFDAPIPSDNVRAPEEFHYLGKKVNVE